MKITLIQDDAQYHEYQDRLDDMLEIEEPSKTELADIEHLIVVIQHYEDANFWQPPYPHPVTAIKFRMAQLGIKQKDMGKYLGVRSKVSEVLNMKRPLTLAMIRKLHFEMGIPADVLLQRYSTK